MALPRCETSKTPTASRTAACSLRTPPPLAVYSIGISQPPKSASLAPSATCRSCRGDRSRSVIRPTYRPRPAGAPGRGPALRFTPCPLRPLYPSSSATSAVKADAVVVGVRRTSDGPGLVSGAEAVDEALGGRLLDALRPLGASGRPDEVLKVPTLGLADVPLVVATGVGDDATDAEAVRRAAGRGAAHADRQAPGAPGPRRAPRERSTEGALLGAYAYTAYKSKPRARQLRTVTVGRDRPRPRREVKRRHHRRRGRERRARSRQHARPTTSTRETFAQRVARAGRGTAGLSVEVLDERALRSEASSAAILGVGQGSVRPPRLVRISYRPAKAAAAPSRSSARASPSTPAASTSRPRT